MRHMAVLCTIFSFVVPVAFAADTPPEIGLAALDFGAEWKLDGVVNQYNAENLYEYIDGEAEFFLPYGFDHCWSARYAKKDTELALVIDVYRLGSPLDGFGVYTSFRRPEAALLATGTEGSVSESLCLFYQGRFFVQIAVSGASQMTADVFTACAKAVAAKLPAGEAPKEIALLRADGVVKGTERYLPKSLLGYTFFIKGLMADAEWDGIKGRVFVVLSDSQEKAATILDQYAEYLGKEGNGSVVSRDKDTLSVIDTMYKGVLVKRVGKRVIGVINPDTPDKSAAMMAKLEAVVKKWAGITSPDRFSAVTRFEDREDRSRGRKYLAFENAPESTISSLVDFGRPEKWPENGCRSTFVLPVFEGGLEASTIFGVCLVPKLYLGMFTSAKLNFASSVTATLGARHF